MGVPTSEVGYTIATTRRETTKVHKNTWWHWKKKYIFYKLSIFNILDFSILILFEESTHEVVHYEIFTSRLLLPISYTQTFPISYFNCIRA